MGVSFEVFVPVIVACFVAILGAYSYSHKVARDIEARDVKDKEAVLRKLDGLVTDIQGMRVALTNRLTRIETTLSIDPPKAPE